MGRSPGSKNYKNLQSKTAEPLEITKEDKYALKDIFTCFNKDFITIKDITESSGLSYDISCKIIRDIKATSDIFHLQGVVHRTDYFAFISKHFKEHELDQCNTDSTI